MLMVALRRDLDLVRRVQTGEVTAEEIDAMNQQEDAKDALVIQTLVTTFNFYFLRPNVFILSNPKIKISSFMKRWKKASPMIY